MKQKSAESTANDKRLSNDHPLHPHTEHSLQPPPSPSKRDLLHSNRFRRDISERDTKSLTDSPDQERGSSSSRSSFDSANGSAMREPRRFVNAGKVALEETGNAVAAIRSTAAQASILKSEKSHAQSIALPPSTQRTTRKPAKSWQFSKLTFGATILAALLGLLIFTSFTTHQLDPVGCSMSYMWPSFARMADFGTEYTRFASKYSLYLYREGGIDEDPRVKGVPVLFIPGNAGSYKQVRPLAAQAAVYYHEVLQHDEHARNTGKRPIDFFTVDFNEDITAFHGQTLLDQAEYLNEAISYILSLYHEPGRFLRDKNLPDPTSVILVGHSMGGIVARTMLTLPNYQHSSINTILTLAAPHARPPVSFDADIVHTYKHINDYWRKNYQQKWANDNKLWHVTLISISGGGLDTVVPSDYSTLASLVPPTHGFTVFTSTIPEVWTGMDHLAITWCNQLRKSVISSIYDVIDANRSSQTRPRMERMTAFKKRFLTGMEEFAERTLPQKQPNTLLTLEDNSNSIVSQAERLVIRELGRSGKAKSYLLPIPPSSLERKSFTLMTDQKLNTPGGSEALEVLFCSVPQLHSSHFSDLPYIVDLSGGSSGSAKLVCKSPASDAIMLPSSREENNLPFDNYLEKDWNVLAGRTPPFSYLQYDLEQLAETQFVAIIDKASHPMPGWVIAEFSSKSDAVVQTDKTLYTMLSSGLDVAFSDRTLMMEIRIPSVFSSLLSYKVSAVKQPCGDDELFRPLLRQHISEPYESKWFVNVQDVDVSMHGIAPYMPPPLKVNSENKGLSLQIWSDPTCNSTLEVSMKVDFSGSIGKLWMRYRTIFAAFPLLVVALVLRKQFQVHNEEGIFIYFSESMDLCLRRSIPALLLALTFLGLLSPRPIDSSLNPFLPSKGGNVTESVIDFTRNDLLLGSQDLFFAFLVPLFGLISVGVCIALNYIFLLLTHIFAIGISIVARFMNKGGDRSNSSLAVTPFRRRLVITCVLLLLVSTVIPYQFVFIVLCVVQLATCVRALRLARDTCAPHHAAVHAYAHSILQLMLWILPINLPTLVVWIRNIAVNSLTPFSSHHNVLSIMPYVLLVETLSTGAMIPPLSGPRGSLQWVGAQITSVALFALAVASAVYGVSFAYLLHHGVNGICTWLVALHFFGGGGGAGLLEWCGFEGGIMAMEKGSAGKAKQGDEKSRRC